MKEKTILTLAGVGLAVAGVGYGVYSYFKGSAGGAAGGADSAPDRTSSPEPYVAPRNRDPAPEPQPNTPDTREPPGEDGPSWWDRFLDIFKGDDAEDPAGRGRNSNQTPHPDSARLAIAAATGGDGGPVWSRSRYLLDYALRNAREQAAAEETSRAGPSVSLVDQLIPQSAPIQRSNLQNSVFAQPESVQRNRTSGSTDPRTRQIEIQRAAGESVNDIVQRGVRSKSSGGSNYKKFSSASDAIAYHREKYGPIKGIDVPRDSAADRKKAANDRAREKAAENARRWTKIIRRREGLD